MQKEATKIKNIGINLNFPHILSDIYIKVYTFGANGFA